MYVWLRMVKLLVPGFGVLELLTLLTNWIPLLPTEVFSNVPLPATFRRSTVELLHGFVALNEKSTEALSARLPVRCWKVTESPWTGRREVWFEPPVKFHVASLMTLSSEREILDNQGESRRIIPKINALLCFMYMGPTKQRYEHYSWPYQFANLRTTV